MRWEAEGPLKINQKLSNVAAEGLPFAVRRLCPRSDCKNVITSLLGHNVGERD